MRTNCTACIEAEELYKSRINLPRLLERLEPLSHASASTETLEELKSSKSVKVVERICTFR